MNLRAAFAPRPRWSLKSSFVAALGIGAAVTAVVLMTLKESVWARLELITWIVAMLMFAFLTLVLYLGVRFDKRERFAIDWPRGRPGDVMQGFGGDFVVFYTEAGAEAGIVGIIVGFILDIIVTIVLVNVFACVVWVGFNVVIGAVLSISLPLFYFFRRALRGIVAKGRDCRGNLGASSIYALRATTGYAVWFYAIFFLAHRLQAMQLR